MSTTINADVIDNLVKMAGPLGVVGGFALAAAYVLHPPAAPPEAVASVSWILIHIGFMVSLLAGIFLLIALLVRYFQAGGGNLGFLGFAMAIVSLMFVFGLDYAEVFIFPVLASEFPDTIRRYGDGTTMPSVAFAFPITGVVFMAGFVLFGRELYRTRAVSPAQAFLLIFGTAVFAIGLSGLPPMIVVRGGACLFGASLAWLGMELWTKPQTPYVA